MPEKAQTGLPGGPAAQARFVWCVGPQQPPIPPAGRRRPLPAGSAGLRPPSHTTPPLTIILLYPLHRSVTRNIEGTIYRINQQPNGEIQVGAAARRRSCRAHDRPLLSAKGVREA